MLVLNAEITTAAVSDISGDRVTSTMHEERAVYVGDTAGE